ncbi:hypothetical protein Y032_0130g1542 [Ancylostoma ceylanicum]|uniref:Uncharacterized protein n=1 Tax=Ancylostoma ceylanicum TaxID=53326 RepID=A0A016T7D8_9BILA|nr:hypothetical protein Y032_0130g1542 [Ancylostoma ceylanicum]
MRIRASRVRLCMYVYYIGNPMSGIKQNKKKPMVQNVCMELIPHSHSTTKTFVPLITTEFYDIRRLSIRN